MGPIRLGIVGAGAIVQSHHAPGFREIAGVEITGVVNRTPASTERAARELGIPRTYRSWRELVADGDIDAVLVATWPYLHAPVTLAALEAGKHVLTQARMAMDVAEARAMLAASLAHPELVAMVVPSPLSFWADRTVRRLLEQDSVGDLRSLRVLWGDPHGRGSQHQPWRRLRRYSGVNTMELGIIYESLARWAGHALWVQASQQLFQPDIAGHGEREAVADIPDYVAVQAALPGAVAMTMELSPHHAFAGPNGVHLFGTTGTLFVDFGEQRLVLTSRAQGREEVVPTAADERGRWRVEEEFVGAVRGEEPVRYTDFATALRYMEFTEAVRRSAAEGRRIPLPPT